MLARRLCKQQSNHTNNKIRNPETQQLLYDPEEILNVFEDYYKKLYSKPPSADEDTIRHFLDTLDLPSIGEMQNNILTTDITQEEIQAAISRLKTNKSAGSDGFPSE